MEVTGIIEMLSMQAFLMVVQKVVRVLEVAVLQEKVAVAVLQDIVDRVGMEVLHVVMVLLVKVESWIYSLVELLVLVVVWELIKVCLVVVRSVEQRTGLR